MLQHMLQYIKTKSANYCRDKTSSEPGRVKILPLTTGVKQTVWERRLWEECKFPIWTSLWCLETGNMLAAVWQLMLESFKDGSRSQCVATNSTWNCVIGSTTQIFADFCMSGKLSFPNSVCVWRKSANIKLTLGNYQISITSYCVMIPFASTGSLQCRKILSSNGVPFNESLGMGPGTGRQKINNT